MMQIGMPNSLLLQTLEQKVAILEEHDKKHEELVKQLLPSWVIDNSSCPDGWEKYVIEHCFVVKHRLHVGSIN